MFYSTDNVLTVRVKFYIKQFIPASANALNHRRFCVYLRKILVISAGVKTYTAFMLFP
jgi:hypothetical protein